MKMLQDIKSDTSSKKEIQKVIIVFSHEVKFSPLKIFIILKHIVDWIDLYLGNDLI